MRSHGVGHGGCWKQAFEAPRPQKSIQSDTASCLAASGRRLHRIYGALLGRHQFRSYLKTCILKCSSFSQTKCFLSVSEILIHKCCAHMIDPSRLPLIVSTEKSRYAAKVHFLKLSVPHLKLLSLILETNNSKVA